MYGKGVATGMAAMRQATKTTRQARLPVATVSSVAALGTSMLPTALCLSGTATTTPARAPAPTISVSALFVTPTSVGCFVSKVLSSSAFVEICWVRLPGKARQCTINAQGIVGEARKGCSGAAVVYHQSAGMERG